MLEKNKARLGETERFESASSQRQSIALKLRFSAGRPTASRILISTGLDNLDRVWSGLARPAGLEPAILGLEGHWLKIPYLIDIYDYI